MPGTVLGVRSEKPERCGPCLQRDYNIVKGDEHSKT